ncbi:DUF362 domain-containing protein [Caloramator sp. E03]|uniref:DUF362 domain-containing protein n=1 Tax=Caloramator sp. E03 TaxID=2576307 RepID=UPI0011107B13|nr:DUF362 domain-containing protein [Caloramator sp. E03]QCX33523.1 DUF362 domain-containing protein [Caloramator sp. E03]
MSKVAVIRCDSYDYDKVKESIKRGIELIGTLESFVKEGERILLKPNMLTGEAPEKCVTTHPVVFKAVAQILREGGAVLSYGDSPALQTPEFAARKCGIEEVAKELDIKFADFNSGEEVTFKEGIQNKRFTIAKGVLECDGIISLPKLKTHGLTKLTGAVKNQFGCIPGKLKGEFHVKLPNVNDFAKMLIDLNKFLKPRLYIMDGIYAMEGNGPRGGTPKKMNVILISSDPVALDSVVCRMVNVNPEYVPTIKFGKEMGLGTYIENEIELVGDDLEQFIDNSFSVNRTPVTPFKPLNFIGGHLRNYIVPKPYIDINKCVKCGVCINICPVEPKAVNWDKNDRKKAPVHNYKKCIRCYCCQELCPESAISIKVPFIRRIIEGKNK